MSKWDRLASLVLTAKFLFSIYLYYSRSFYYWMQHRLRKYQHLCISSVFRHLDYHRSLCRESLGGSIYYWYSFLLWRHRAQIASYYHYTSSSDTFRWDLSSPLYYLLRSQFWSLSFKLLLVFVIMSLRKLPFLFQDYPVIKIISKNNY